MIFLEFMETYKKNILNKIDCIEFNLEQSTPLFVKIVN